MTDSSKKGNSSQPPLKTEKAAKELSIKILELMKSHSPLKTGFFTEIKAKLTESSTEISSAKKKPKP